MPPKIKKKVVKSDKSYLTVVPRLSSLGLVVIPLEDKRPILQGWNRLEKTPERLYVFENRNLGILTGHVSGITILDIDVKDHGLETWMKISSVYPDIYTPTVRTSSGGLHIYFKYNKRLHSFSRFTLKGTKIGWDLLNNDRQAVVPPSKNSITKKAYEWVVSPFDVGFVNVPSWLEEYLLTCKSFK
jgi:Bifunctional DNA primase/polymerase, N-terminal